MSYKGGKIGKLKSKTASFPQSSGVYVIRDSQKSVIYVGKAKNLRARTSSYFTGDKDIKTRFLVQKAADIEVIITTTEYEALVLENNLIKRHKPKYNINLKDGKSYPVIRISSEPFPRVFRTRRIIRDGSDYFGPYPKVNLVDVYIDLIHKLFPLRRCKQLKKRDRPCLYHHIGRCSAPCVGNIKEEEYGRYIKKIRALLSGRTVVFRKEIEKEMREASNRLAFERAAELRDALISLDAVDTEPTMMDFREESRDYIDFMASGRHIVFAVIQMRGGQVSDRQLYVNEYAGDPAEALPEFLLQYYMETGRERPHCLLMRTSPDPLIHRFFSEEKDNHMEIIIPQNKRDEAILNIVRQNAEAELGQIIRSEGDMPALEELKQVLALPKIPRRIEGFDIAQLHGKHAVASLISFIDGRPDKAGYRHYGIKSTAGAIDDYKSIAEAVSRRYQRLLAENLPLPDLILVDGGKGQVSAALSILEILQLDKKISLVGLAKREEEIWLPYQKNPVRLPLDDPGLRVLIRVRDETHRFATAHSKRLREKSLTLYSLEAVPGIGPVKSAKLLTTYKSLEGIYAQRANEIAKTASVAESVAETVREFLGRALESRNIAKETREGKGKQR